MSCDKCEPWILSASTNMGPFPSSADVEDTGLKSPYHNFMLQCRHCGHIWESVKPVYEPASGSPELQYAAIVTGSREWEDPELVQVVLSRCLEQCALQGLEFVMRVGDCDTGVDHAARAWAAEMGVTTHEYIADWKQHGRAAGPIRNSEMVDAGGRLCLAFWDLREKGSGTFDCFKKAIRAGIATEVYGPNWTGK